MSVVEPVCYQALSTVCLCTGCFGSACHYNGYLYSALLVFSRTTCRVSLCNTKLHYTCCYDEINGNQDLHTCSHADSLLLSLHHRTACLCVACSLRWFWDRDVSGRHLADAFSNEHFNSKQSKQPSQNTSPRTILQSTHHTAQNSKCPLSTQCCPLSTLLSASAACYLPCNAVTTNAQFAVYCSLIVVDVATLRRQQG